MSDRDAFVRVYRNSRREALLVLLVWAIALFWTVGYCYLNGYDEHAPDSWLVQTGLAAQRSPDNFQHFWGLPDWVVVGILIPWMMSSAFNIGFCLGMTDDDLGTEAEEGEAHGH